MRTIEVFDPPMCCPTGVCGPEPDERLARFTADLDWLKRQGVPVRRHNLAQDPAAFTANPRVKQVLEATDGEGLPVILADGRLVSQGEYPARDALARWAEVNGKRPAEAEEDAGAPEGQPIFDERIAELVALGAAIASNCEPCFKFHYRKAVDLGVHPEDMIQAVNVALGVKEQPAQIMVRLARRLLVPEAPEPGGESGYCAPGQGCC